jgi:hypothetical protein
MVLVEMDVKESSISAIEYILETHILCRNANDFLGFLFLSQPIQQVNHLNAVVVAHCHVVQG